MKVWRGWEETQRDEAMLKTTPEVNLTESPEAGSNSLRTCSRAKNRTCCGFVFSLTGRRAVAEEIVQEIFLQLHAKWADVNDPRAWLFRSARNKPFTTCAKAAVKP